MGNHDPKAHRELPSGHRHTPGGIFLFRVPKMYTSNCHCALTFQHNLRHMKVVSRL